MRELNIDNSRLEPIAKCTTMAVLKSVHGMRSKGEKWAADVGTAGHEALLCWFVQHPENISRSTRTFEARYEELLGDAPVEPRLNKVNVRKILETWFEKHSLETFPFEVVEGEVTVGYKLINDVWMWCKRDLLVRDKQTGILAPLDHKTTGQNLSSWWLKQFRLGSQMSGYIWGAKKEDARVFMGYINAIQINKLPENMGYRCGKHKVKYAECWKEHVNYLLATVQRTDGKLRDWEREAKWLANRLQLLKEVYPSVELAKLAPKEGRFNGSCVFCEFNDFCAGDCADVLLQELLVHDPWEPWKGENVRRVE